MHKFKVFFSFCCLFSFSQTYSQDNVHVISEDHYIAQEIHKIIHFDTPINPEYTPGMLILMLDQDSSWIYQWGHRTLDKTEVIPIEATFEIGSVTKLFVSAVIGQLVSEGKLDWEMSINELLPDECRNEKLANISLTDLTSHQSGLAKLPAFIGDFQDDAQNPYEHYSKTDLCQYVNELPLIASEKSVYSHLNYALLEVGLENHFDKSLQQIWNETIAAKFNLRNTNFHLDEKLTDGYTLGVIPSTPRQYNSFAASEGLRSSLRDLAKFSRWQLGVGANQPDEMAVELQKAIGKSNFGGGIQISRGWHIAYPKKKKKVFMQTGKGNGHHAAVTIMPETKTGVIILSNSALGSFDLSYLILRMMNGNWKRKPSK